MHHPPKQKYLLEKVKGMPVRTHPLPFSLHCIFLFL